MQTDLLLKQIASSLTELKTAIEKFEKHSSPSIQYAEQLYKSLSYTEKLVSAYVVSKEHDEISPELNIHSKLMEVKPVEAQQELKIELIEPVAINEEKKVSEPTLIIKEEIALKTEESIYPKLNININDKFRFINELFSANSNEYAIAIEQLNAANSLIDALNYYNGLKDIYQWNENNELVKKLIVLIEKRFL